jgi:hypothetical protein
MRKSEYQSRLLAIGMLILCGTQAIAQQTKGTEPALVVNGIPVENAIRTIGGRPYIDLEAIAKALNLSVSSSSRVIVLEARTSVPAAHKNSSTIPVDPASVSGNLTYFFNRNYGNKPDVGAKIYLIDGSVNFVLRDEDFLFSNGEYLIVAANKENKTTYRIVHSTVADGNGHYEFKGVAPGRYTLVAISSHARGKVQAEILGKVLKKSLDLSPGSTVDVSHDFGMTYY